MRYHGTPRDVSAEHADQWWISELPSLQREWQEETDAYHRSQEPARLVRDWLAQRKLDASVLTSNRSTHAIPTEMWAMHRAEHIFYLDYAEFSRVNSVDLYTYGGLVFLNRAQLTSVIASEEQTPLTHQEIPFDAAQAAKLTVDEDRFPYLAFHAARFSRSAFRSRRAAQRKGSRRLAQSQLKESGAPKEIKIQTMATFLCRPRDERRACL